MLNLKGLVLGRAKSQTVEFLAPFVEVAFSANGIGKLALDADSIKPVGFGLMVPVGVDGVPLYNDTIGAELSWEVKGTKLTVAPEAWKEFLSVEGGSRTALVSIPRKYQARKMSALLPAEIRKMTSSSADVMAMINDRDPEMVNRISAIMSEKVKAKQGLSDSQLSGEIEAAINVELTMKYPDLLMEIERVQMAQSAIQLAVMLGEDQAFFVTLQMDISGGEEMISQLMRIIDPPVQPSPPTPAVIEAAVKAAEADGTIDVKSVAVEPVFEADEDEDDFEDDEFEDAEPPFEVAPTTAPIAAVEATETDDDDEEWEDEEDEEE